jgi:amino acid adenylation domain-containing protein
MAPDGLAARFTETASMHGSRIALSTSSGHVTYAELLADAQRVADALLASGIKSPAAITVSRTRASVTAILGAIVAGIPYAPVDAGYPETRLRFMLDDLAAAIHIDGTGSEPVIHRSDSPALGQPNHRGDSPALGQPNHRGDSPALGQPNHPGDSPAPGHPIHPDAIYVLYTSGSTGVPKGCVVTHRNVLSLFDATRGLFDPSHHDVSAVLHSLAFDFSVWEMWSSWLYGGTCWLAEPEVVRDPERLSAALDAHQVTRLSATPSLFAYLATAMARRGCVLPRLRSLVLGGEAVSLPDVARFLSSGCAPNVRVVNMYGITETTVHVTFRELSGTETGGQPGSTPIGLPIPSLRLSLRDEHGDPVEPGAPGEMWISGEGTCAGYLNRPALTAERFVTDDKAVTWYRSGDLARYDGGEYHYLGRLDRQVQLRGHRIELGEVEAVLETFDEVERAVAAVEERPATGRPALVAYVKASGAPGAVTVKDIKARARRVLPPQAVPQTVHLVPDLPLNQHGKLDVAGLRAAIARRS